LQHISLLSGGEKALTAMALLFALFRIKPSPLCVLDEVDAPLDEANIDRFLNVLRTFQGSTQFLIVTHNRKTIAMGDFLYGVTMEESGISKLVSVKVAQSEPKIAPSEEKVVPA
jgi:chromosome segregation protein